MWDFLYDPFYQKMTAFTNKCNFIYDSYECHSFLDGIDGITPIHTNMAITNRVKITISPFRLHAASSVRIPTSTHSFRSLLPTVRIRPLNLFSASSGDLHGASN